MDSAIREQILKDLDSFICGVHKLGSVGMLQFEFIEIRAFDITWFQLSSNFSILDKETHVI